MKNRIRLFILGFLGMFGAQFQVFCQAPFSLTLTNSTFELGTDNDSQWFVAAAPCTASTGSGDGTSAIPGAYGWVAANSSPDVCPFYGTQVRADKCNILAYEGGDYLGFQSTEAVRQTLTTALTAGQTYTFTIYVRGGVYNGSPGMGQLNVYFSTSSTWGSASQILEYTSPVTTSSWAPVTVTFTANAAYSRIYLQCKGTLTTDGNSIGVDAASVILPIELANFNANLKDRRTEVTWQTATEHNNDYFLIERSQNGSDWELLDVVDGAGNSTELLSYKTYDFNPYRGVSYYRLKQIDFDGKYSYSKIRSVYNTDDLMILPNPSTGIFGIGGMPKHQENSILVMDITGQILEQHTIDEESYQLDLTHKSAGVYFVIINGTESIKVIKE